VAASEFRILKKEGGVETRKSEPIPPPHHHHPHHHPTHTTPTLNGACLQLKSIKKELGLEKDEKTALVQK
jgi:hypothetical protein